MGLLLVHQLAEMREIRGLGDDGQRSDLRLKEDVRCVGTTVFGLPLYHFKYLGKPETYEGLIAQDVLQLMPSAVSVGGRRILSCQLQSAWN
jgi:hypothetical protein